MIPTLIDDIVIYITCEKFNIENQTDSIII